MKSLTDERGFLVLVTISLTAASKLVVTVQAQRVVKHGVYLSTLLTLHDTQTKRHSCVVQRRCSDNILY
eukprot:m.142232 g.142232  ORF g.142232 m.142232 type:complete len:69 (-) comp14060_c0_seq1:77-283(-)